MSSIHDCRQQWHRAEQFSWQRLTLPTPFPVGPVNVYLLQAEPLTLIDTGPDTMEARSSLTAALNEIGFAPKDIEQVVITHGHSDHAGLAAWFQEMGADVLLHPLEAERLSGLDFWPTQREHFRQLSVPEKLLDAAQILNRRMAAYRGDCLAGHRPLQEGDTLEFTSYCLSVLAVPGHCGGHLAFYQEKSGMLLAGDTLLKKISPYLLVEVHPTRPEERSRSLSQFLSTMDRLEKLPLKLVLTGHGEPLETPEARIAEIKSHHNRRLQRIREILQSRGSCTPFELACQLYGRLSGWDMLLAVSDVSARLDWLVAHGVLAETADYAGRLTYKPQF
ncbi:MAG: MBL fold metallo-hydrolase [Dethiobacter sp.]|nr:MBL fold metallo-hydrolase [Dethiobacter sp.]